MTNKYLDGGQWPADIQVFDYERMFGCIPERTDKKGQSYILPFPCIWHERNTGWDKVESGTICNQLVTMMKYSTWSCFSAMP